MHARKADQLVQMTNSCYIYFYYLYYILFKLSALLILIVLVPFTHDFPTLFLGGSRIFALFHC